MEQSPIKEEVIIPKTWRSELGRVITFGVLSLVCLPLSQRLPWTVVTGKLWSTGEHVYYLSLPLLWFIPMFVLTSAIIRIYNVRYSIDPRGIESRVGILSMHQSITRIRFEDIRSIETDQTLMQRLLDVGMVEMGTAATGAMELIFDGVGSPTKVQELIQRERDQRIASLKKAEREGGPAARSAESNLGVENQ